MDKLAHYGVRGIGNNSFETYLTNRKQYVTVSGQKSDNASIEFGVHCSFRYKLIAWIKP